MRRKESNSSSGFASAKNFLTAFALNNFERGLVDSARMDNFNNFLRGLTERMTKNPTQLTAEVLKVVVDLIVGLEGNLRITVQRAHTYTCEDVVKFFVNIVDLFEKVSFIWGNYEKLVNSDIINIFAALLSDREDEVASTEIQARSQLLNTLCQHQEEHRQLPLHYECSIRQVLYMVNLPLSQQQFAGSLFISFLRQGTNLQPLKEILAKYIQQCMSINHSGGFKKALSIYQHFGSKFEQRRANMESLVVKTFESNHCLSYIFEINKIFSFAKLFQPQNQPRLIVKLIEKIIEKNNLSSAMVKLLEQLSQIEIEHIQESAFEKLDCKFDSLFLRIMDWVISRNAKEESLLGEAELIKSRMEQSELRQERIIEFVKKLNSRGSEQEGDSFSVLLQRACDSLTVILLKLSSNRLVRDKIAIKDLDALPFLKNNDRLNQTVKRFILEVVPQLLEEYTINVKDKSAIKYAILLRRAEIEADRLARKGHNMDALFRQAYFQMVQAQSLNFHYLICFVFLKYQTDKHLITDFLIDETLKDLRRSAANKSNRNLILNLSLFLKSLEHVFTSQSIKYKVRQIIKEYQLLMCKLEVGQLFAVSPKELTKRKQDSFDFSQKCVELRDELNLSFCGYEKEQLNLFYFMIIEINDIMQSKPQRNSLLWQIKEMRTLNFMGEYYTCMRALLDKLAQWRDTRDNIILILQMLLKLNHAINSSEVSQSEDIFLVVAQLQQFLIEINSHYDLPMLSALVRFKTNPMQFYETPLVELLREAQIVKFYSECAQDLNRTRIILTRVSLLLLKRVCEMKSISMHSFEPELKDMYLLYRPSDCLEEFGFVETHLLQMKIYTYLQLLSLKLQHNQSINGLLLNLRDDYSTIRELTLKKHETDHLRVYKGRFPLDWPRLCVENIKKAIVSNDKQVLQVFKFVVAICQDDAKQGCHCCQQLLITSLAAEVGEQLMQFIIKRARLGLTLEEKETAQFLANSTIFYRLLSQSMAINKSHLLAVVEELIQLDEFTNCDKSAYILKEIACMFSVIEEKQTQICETIFDYILTLADIFPGEQKLEISNFICNFFGLTTQSNKESSLQTLEKEKTTKVKCSNQPSYKCLLCDDKRIFCLGCAIACHKDHPVCFVNLPPELKSSKCQCKDIAGSTCKHNPREPSDLLAQKDNIFNPSNLRVDFPPPVRNYHSALLGSPSAEMLQKMKYYNLGIGGLPSLGPGGMGGLGGMSGMGGMGMRMPVRQIQEPAAERIQMISYLQEEELMEQELGSRWYNNAMRDEYIPKIGTRLERIFERDEYPGRIPLDRGDGRKPAMAAFLKEKTFAQEREKEENDCLQSDFAEEQYEADKIKMEVQEKQQMEQNATILKKHVLLPKFIDLMTNFCAKRSQKTSTSANVERWKLLFVNPTMQRQLFLSFRLNNPNSFMVDIRKENPINNVSCVLIKKNIAQNNKFMIIVSGADLLVFSKEKLFNCAADMKPIPGYGVIHKHSVTYELHSVEISPNDKTLLCASGLHNLALFTLSPEGQIARTSLRYNVSNLYINKIKLAKMGIFVGVEKEIRILNYTCKHIITLKAQESNTLIREWTIYEKAAGCQVSFVCPNGNIFFVDVLPSDEGKKDFVGRITDQRKTKSGTGASVFIKQLPDLGKYLFASFKDGYNIIGHLQAEQVEDMTDIRLKNIKCDKNIFDNNFIIGHVDVVKLAGIDDVFVVCTVKKYFPPEMSFHQGYLVVVRFKKDGNTDIQIVNDESTCEYFQVFYIGAKHFIVVSLHSDGSLLLSTPTKIPKAVAEEEARKMKESEQASSGGQLDNKSQSENILKVRAALDKHLSIDKVVNKNISSSYFFRQNADHLKLASQYMVVKSNQTEYQFKQLNFSRIVTGMSLPFFGDVQLPTRTINNVFEVGFTTLQALYFYAHGGFKFIYRKNQSNKYARQSMSHNSARMLERIERIERMNEGDDRLFNSNIMNSFLGMKEEANQDLVFLGTQLQTFKGKISKFDQIFNVNSDDESSSIEKTAMIIKMFLSKSLKEGNQCSQEQLMQLVEGIKTIVATSPKRLFLLLKEIIVLSIKVYEKQENRELTIQSDQNYALRAATENRLTHYYNLLKLDIGDDELNDFLDLLLDILHEDTELMTYYCAKYTSLFTQLNRRVKKPDTEERAIALIELYSFAYPILKYCEVPCIWMVININNIIYDYIASLEVRRKLYEGLKRDKCLILQPWLKNISSNQMAVEEAELPKKQEPKEEGGKDQMTQIYNMYNRGEIDEDTLIKMIQEATKIEFEKEQENNQQNVEADNPYREIQPEMEMEMQMEITTNHNASLITDLIDECTDSFLENADISYSRIISLYVISKAIDSSFEESTDHLLKRTKKMVSDMDLKAEGQKLTIILAFSCLFNKILTNSQYLKKRGGKSYALYQELEMEVTQKLSKVPLQKVNKIKNPPNLMGRIFRGDKPVCNIHIAYALTSLLLFPCEPTHVLLSLECYWLLPQSRQFYSKQKDISNIKDGIESGNLKKVYEIVKVNPLIWQELNYLQVIQKWISDKRQDWELALELLAIYYSG